LNYKELAGLSTALIEAVRTLSLLAAACYAAWQARAIPIVCLYFLAQILYTIAVEATLRVSGATSKAYLGVYAIFTAIVLLMAFWVVWDNISCFTYRLRRMALYAVTATCLTRFVEVGVGHPLGTAAWVVLAEGGILYFLGSILCATAVYSERNGDVRLILGILWLCQAGLFWGFELGLPEVRWLEIGQYVPTMLCVAAFTLCGLRLRQPRPLLHRGC
jgi:hypothetical protein